MPQLVRPSYDRLSAGLAARRRTIVMLLVLTLHVAVLSSLGFCTGQHRAASEPLRGPATMSGDASEAGND